MLSAPLTGVYSMKSRFVALIKSLETFFFSFKNPFDFSLFSTTVMPLFCTTAKSIHLVFSFRGRCLSI